MKLKIGYGGTYKYVEISPDDPVNILKEKLNINNEIAATAELFTFRGKFLLPLCSYEKFRYIKDLKEGDRLHIRVNLPYAAPEDINKFVREDKVSKNDPNIPEWRTIGKGINLYGICNNDNCQAKGKQVIMHVKSKEFDVVKEGFKGICPMCKKQINLDACSFYKCDYNCQGKYFKGDILDDIGGCEHKTNGGKNFYLDFNKIIPGQEGKVKYEKLILNVINYHDNE